MRQEQDFLFDELKEIIQNSSHKRISKSDITLKTRLIEDLSFESISLIQLVTNIEEEMEIIFDAENLLAENLNIVGDLFAQIKVLKGA